MTITEAMRAVNDEHNAECRQCQKDKAFATLFASCIGQEYIELEEELMGYVSDIGRAHGLPHGTIVPVWVCQLARMCFRFGMRVQRKLDRPEEATSTFWRSDGRPV